MIIFFTQLKVQRMSYKNIRIDDISHAKFVRLNERQAPSVRREEARRGDTMRW